MVTIKGTAHGVDIYDVWYAKDKVEYKGIIHYRQAENAIAANCEEFITLENDLTLDEDEIISGISKNGRYEIRRAERENVVTKLCMSNDISDSDIDCFLDFFTDFWDTKGVAFSDAFNLKRELLAYRELGALAIGTASIADNIIVYHTYIVDGEKVRLLHSASLYRTSEDVPKSILGMANRMLHKDEILNFKSSGKEVYDWGGAGTGPEVAGITEFKKSFGGTQKIYYDVTIVNGLKANLLSKMSEIKNRLKRR